jgi:hypothetical protein
MVLTPTTTTAVPTVLDNWITFFKAHEKILIIILAGALALHFYGTALNAWVNHDKAAQTIEEQKSATLAQQNSLLAQQGAQLLTAVTASNAALAKAASQRAEQTKAQQAADMTLPLPQVGQHWVSLINVAPADIQAQPDGSMKVSDAASRATVSQLDAGVEAAADLKGAQQTAANDQTVINQQTQQIISDKDTIAQDKATCDSEKSTLKAQNKKSFWTGFKWGIGVGIGVSAAVMLHKVL